MKRLPSISVIMPTLNAARVIESSLSSIASQDYPQDLVEIIIADAGSTDDTLKIAKKFGAVVVPNPRRTGEAGKAEALKVAKNEVVALIDSDNILPEKNWFQKMVAPFADSEILGSEPVKYTWRKEDGYITRYSALMGMNDPLCMFLGNYDRYNFITRKWTGLPVEVEDKDGYLKIKLNQIIFPTMGANGFLVRREALLKHFSGKYFFDIDIFYDLVKDPQARFAKVKVGIVHLYCDTPRTFFRKQLRRIRDYQYFSKEGLRQYPWQALSKVGLLKFVVYCLLFFPLVGQALLGWWRTPDWAWAFHPLACEITFWTYSFGKLEGVIRSREQSREGWKQ